jgi:hypothetical protein
MLQRSLASMGSLVILSAAGLGAAVPAVAAVPAYTLVGTYDSAVAGAGGGVGAIGLDSGGLLWQIVGDDVYRQTAVNAGGAGGFVRVGALPAGSADFFGASFIQPSPDGTLLAIGNGKFGPGAGVHVVSTAGLSTSTPTAGTFVSVPNYSAAWAGDARLYVTGFGATSQVARVDLTAPATVTTVITGVGDGSGGIASRGGTLYVGAGFGTGVGDVRTFPLTSLNAAASSVVFTAGAFHANAFTAAGIDFDALGNTIIAGQSFSDPNGVAVIDVAGGGARFDLPGLNPLDQYTALFNPVTGEILVRGRSSPTVYRYAIPAPGAASALAGAGVLALAQRRRRPAAGSGARP